MLMFDDKYNNLHNFYNNIYNNIKIIILNLVYTYDYLFKQR